MSMLSKVISLFFRAHVRLLLNGLLTCSICLWNPGLRVNKLHLNQVEKAGHDAIHNQSELVRLYSHLCALMLHTLIGLIKFFHIGFTM
jgi:hypothetical protein